jgi:hypothetical protein
MDRETEAMKKKSKAMTETADAQRKMNTAAKAANETLKARLDLVQRQNEMKAAQRALLNNVHADEVRGDTLTDRPLACLPAALAQL